MTEEITWPDILLAFAVGIGMAFAAVVGLS